jgi:NAD(P)-dependent dehydrogenase (short-subunit alcohol dehydrogenase family)
MRKGHKGGNIISLSSVGGARAHWHSIPYDITKGAIDSLTRALALEVSAEGIRVNAIGPGAIQNRTYAGADNPEGDPAELPLIPLGRYGIPQDIASMVAFLASPEAGYITGQVFYVDGGLLAQLSPREHPI